VIHIVEKRRLESVVLFTAETSTFILKDSVVSHVINCFIYTCINSSFLLAALLICYFAAALSFKVNMMKSDNYFLGATSQPATTMCLNPQVQQPIQLAQQVYSYAPFVPSPLLYCWPTPAAPPHPIAQVHYVGVPTQNQVVQQLSYGSAPVSYYGALIVFPQAFHTVTLNDPRWNMDTGASSHLADNTSILATLSNQSMYPSIFVGNDQSIPVTNIGHSSLLTPHKPLPLNNILVTPNIIKNLIYVHQFTKENDVSVEFDAFGFSVKDYHMRQLLLRCDSTEDLYPVTHQPSSTPFSLLSFSHSTFHRRLGHLGEDVLRNLVSRHLINCNSSAVKPATIRTRLSLDVSHSWPTHQLDVKNAFLHGHLSEIVYMHQPPRFVDPQRPDYVCHLQRSLYGLKHASRAWF
ncbi:ribonuclease H-like domain-containing protein, partial [Tanacetum coccineum]